MQLVFTSGTLVSRLKGGYKNLNKNIMKKLQLVFAMMLLFSTSFA